MNVKVAKYYSWKKIAINKICLFLLDCTCLKFRQEYSLLISNEHGNTIADIIRFNIKKKLRVGFANQIARRNFYISINGFKFSHHSICRAYKLWYWTYLYLLNKPLKKLLTIKVCLLLEVANLIMYIRTPSSWILIYRVYSHFYNNYY